MPENRSIDVQHWQKFARRLRKQKGKFRFFHCGEYGELYYRPHYHAAIFGMDFSEDRIKWKVKNGNQYYVSEELTRIWGKGHCVISNLTFDSAAYVARYIMKKQTGPDSDAYYLWVDYETGEEHERQPEYTTMSRKPGIGRAWIDKYKKETYNADSVIINGRETRPPKYYDGIYEENHPQEMETVKAKRRKAAWNRREDNTPERLAVKEKCQAAKLKLSSRDIDRTT